MSYEQSIDVWLWSNGISTAIGILRLIYTIAMGVMAIRNGGNGIDRILFILNSVMATGLLAMPAFFLYAGLRADRSAAPPTSVGQDRVSEVAMILIIGSVVGAFLNIMTAVLEYLLYQGLRRVRRKEAPWLGEERRQTA